MIRILVAAMDNITMFVIIRSGSAEKGVPLKIFDNVVLLSLILGLCAVDLINTVAVFC